MRTSNNALIGACTLLGLGMLVVGGFLVDFGFGHGGGAIMFVGGFLLFCVWAEAQESRA